MFYVRSIYVLCPWRNARVFSIEKTVVNSGFNVDDIFLVKKKNRILVFCVHPQMFSTIQFMLLKLKELFSDVAKHILLNSTRIHNLNLLNFCLYCFA